MNSSLLKQLKDIHHPGDVNWWPLAPGWYGLALFLLLVLGIIAYYIYAYYQKKKRIQLIKQSITELKMRIKSRDPKLISDCSQLVRRVALMNYPREEVAGITGEAWLVFLDETGNTQQFTQGSGRLLITAAYQQQWDNQATDLVLLIERWINTCLK